MRPLLFSERPVDFVGILSDLSTCSTSWIPNFRAASDTSEPADYVSSMVTKEVFRISGPLGIEADSVSALAFFMDKGLAYIPVLHSGYDLWQASACATLDFSIWVFTHSLNLELHIAEQKYPCCRTCENF
jgi:hypothetical protein